MPLTGTPTDIFLGLSDPQQSLSLRYANRHGLIAGATGTGKTVTLQVLAEGFSRAGVPVFLADVKGDVAGLGAAGEPKPGLLKRAEKVGLIDYTGAAAPVCFWDIYGEQGHPIRTTISEMGPLLLARLLGLNETQEGALSLAFRVADDENLLLLDMKDLRALLTEVGNRASDLSLTYGHIARATIGAIQRRLLALEEQGADKLFGEPALELSDLMRTDAAGRGVINILAADKLMSTPKTYATFLLWLLSELFEELPEIGDPDKPRLVFFFDEAHLLFDEAPKALLTKVEQVVRLIRSKGVGVYFVTQNPQDLPDSVSSQLGARIQHALRAFTPKEQKVVRTAAQMFRANPAFSTEAVITELEVGEALISTLVDKGVPSTVARTLLPPPTSRIGPLTPDERRALIATSPMSARYDRPIDRVSAYEILTARHAAPVAETGKRKGEHETQKPKPRARSSNRQTVSEAAIKSAVRTFSTGLAREVLRGVMGTWRKR